MKGITTQQGRDTLNRFKMEAASEVGVNLKQGYNGDLTSREAGSVGGQMVKTMMPEQQWRFQRRLRSVQAHKLEITYTLEVIA